MIRKNRSAFVIWLKVATNDVASMMKRLIQFFRSSEPSGRNYYDDQLDEFFASLRLQKEAAISMNGKPMSAEWERLFLFMQQWKMDLEWHRDLWKAVIIPQVEKFGRAKRLDAKGSKYAHLIDLDHQEFSDTYDVVRLGYVHLYHKIEAFRDKLFDELDNTFGFSGSWGIRKACKRLYGFDPKEGFAYIPLVNEIAFVCNSAKHTEGKPIVPRGGKYTTPERFQDVPIEEKLRLFGFELVKDCDDAIVLIFQLFHAMTIVHRQQETSGRVAYHAFSTYSKEDQNMLVDEELDRKKHALHLISTLFSNAPDKIKRHWEKLDSELSTNT